MSEGEKRERQAANGERDKGDGPKVWIASLSDYNAGHLHGAWADADQDEDGLWNDINAVLRSSPSPGAEEWAIFDYEGFGPLRLSEYEGVARITRLGRGIAEHGEAFAAFAHYLGQQDEMLAQFEDCYLGQWKSAEAYVQDYVESAGIESTLDFVLPESLRPYVKVDVEAMAREMELEGALLEVPASNGDVFLFHPP
jgi:antirestriction protein